MDSKLEAHIDEIFIDVPKTDKMVTMINRIKSKANSKFLQIRDQGYSRSVAFNEVDDWLMKAKVIVDEEAGKLTPAELATIKTPATPYNAPAGEVVSNASLDDGGCRCRKRLRRSRIRGCSRSIRHGCGYELRAGDRTRIVRIRARSRGRSNGC